MTDLSGKVAIITGASRGIGEAIAQALARAGAAVVVTSRKMENVGRVAEEIRAMGGHALGVEAHAGRADHANAVAEVALAEYGQVDILVNNAGTNPHFGPVLTA